MAGIVDNVIAEAKKIWRDHKEEAEGLGMIAAGLLIAPFDIELLEIPTVALLGGGLYKLSKSKSPVVRAGARAAGPAVLG